jgi:hypothetical protein
MTKSLEIHLGTYEKLINDTINLCLNLTTYISGQKKSKLILNGKQFIFIATSIHT